MTNNDFHCTDVPAGMKGQHYSMSMHMLETFDDEQPKPKAAAVNPPQLKVVRLYATCIIELEYLRS